MDIITMKKDFQKVIAEIRKGLYADAYFPKAMMTNQQMRKRTATVNCGASYCHTRQFTVSIANTVMHNAHFHIFLDKYGATAKVEDVVGGVQIRINY